MAAARLRPVFDATLPCEPTRFLAEFERRLHSDGPIWNGFVMKDYALLRVAEQERRFWSPALHLQILPGGGNAPSRLHGCFSPSSPIWTFFIACYVLAAMVALAGISYGWAQSCLEQSPSALWAVPAALVFAAIVWWASQVGQRLGADDMGKLRGFVEATVRACETPKALPSSGFASVLVTSLLCIAMPVGMALSESGIG